jgi:hypothetical protein
VITAADRALESGIETVDEFFDGVFAPLDAWLPRLGEQLRQQLRGGPMSGAQLAALVEPEAHAILDASDRPLYGAGYCASESVVSEGNPLAWWQGPERSLLASSTFGPGQAAITSSIPVMLDGGFAGVVCADVLVSSLEGVLLPSVAELPEATLVNAGGRVVVSSDPGYETGDRFAGGGLDSLDDSVRVARSSRYPFALVAPR